MSGVLVGSIIFDIPDAALIAKLQELLSANPQLHGQSAYQVAVANGFTGTQAEWLVSLIGPTGAGVLLQRIEPAVCTPLTLEMATPHTSWSSTGRTVTITRTPGRRTLVRAWGKVGALNGNIIHFGLEKNNALIALPTGYTGLDSVRVPSSSDLLPFRVHWSDPAPVDISTDTYKLVWKATTAGNTPILGRRWENLDMVVPTHIVAEEYAP